MILVVAVAFVPIYSSFIRTGETTYRSEIAYRAVQVAREQLQEARTMPLWGIPARPKVGDQPARPAVEEWKGFQEWRPVAGKHVLELSTSSDQDRGALERLTYPQELYEGIETQLWVISPSNAPGATLPEDDMDAQHIRIISLKVRWQEKGEAEKGGQLKNGLQLFTALAVRR